MERLRAQVAAANDKAAAAETVAERAVKEAREVVQDGHAAFRQHIKEVAEAMQQEKEVEVAVGVAAARSEALALLDEV